MDIDIDTMEAGREMDALVAERVMGWTQIKTWSGSPIADGWLGFWDGTWPIWVDLPDIVKDDPDTLPTWNPSTDIAAAIKVWQKLAGAHEIGFDYGHHEAGGELYLDHECIAQSDECTDVEAAFCLATCRAALKATDANQETP